MQLRQELRAGDAYLDLVTRLLQRIRTADPTRGSYEAADLQWWSTKPRPTDDVNQLFWFDDVGPVAAIILTAWGSSTALNPMLLPDAAPELIDHVLDRGLAHANTCGFATVELEVDRRDLPLRTALESRGFAMSDAGMVEAWLSTQALPAPTPPPAGYRLIARQDVTDRPHHMASRSGPDIEQLLKRTSIYRPDLDLVAVDAADSYAAYGLFWSDPVTATGLVEPVRTEDDHQQRGLARHIMTTGVNLLGAAGAERIKIAYEPDNAAADHLYRSVGFEPVTQTDMFEGPTAIT